MISTNTYEEVYEILQGMDKSIVMKIPEEILLTIKTKRNRNFTTSIDKNDIFNENNISKESVDLLCWLDYTYWKNETEKAHINKIIKKKIISEEIIKRNCYNPDDIFTNKKQRKQHINKETISLIEYKETVFSKIKKSILKLFTKIYNKYIIHNK